MEQARTVIPRVKLIFIIERIWFIHIGADRYRMFQIQHRISGIILSYKFSHRTVILKHIAFFLLMAGKKAVKGHDHRQSHHLRDLDGAKVHIIDRLGCICKQDHPSGIQCIHNVTVVAFDGQRP